MNRSIALFVALAVLLAHILALHNDGAGNIAFPYDQAHAAYRMAHNLVVEGQLQWNPGTTAYESYPSPLWIAICAVGERLSATRLNSSWGLLSINLFCQTIGVLAMLTCVVLASQFRPDRVASLIAPLFLVASGCIAAAAANGLETALFALCALATFLGFERARSGYCALFAVLLCLTRAEGVLVVVALLALLPFSGPALKDEREVARKAWPLVLGLLAFAGSCGLRWLATGSGAPPSFVSIVQGDASQRREGLEYLRDFVCTFPAVLLAIQPVCLLVLRRLSGTGARALVLAGVWLAFVALQGRAPLPFCELCVPAVPFLAIALQEGLIEALDSPSMLRRRAAIAVFLVALVACALPSNTPADIGPFPLERWQRTWLASSGSARFGYAQTLGREGLEEEIRRTHALRGLGLFLRDHLDPATSVLTPWPGAVGYLAHTPVYDLLGRTNPMADIERPRPWSVRSRVDLVGALRSDPPYDYLVADVEPFVRLPTPRELAESWCAGLDREPASEGRSARVAAELERYELVTVPISSNSRSRGDQADLHFALLRRRELGLAPRLEIAREGPELVVRVRHATHRQIADLRLTARDEHGRTHWMRPDGEWTEKGPLAARLELLLYDTGTRAIELVRVRLPDTLDEARVSAIEARLVNPEALEEQPYAWVSAPAQLQP